MKIHQSIERREFLRAASGAVGLTAGLQNLFAAAPVASGHAKAEKVLAAMEAKGVQFLSVPPKDGQFLKLLIKATQAKRVLEVGTSQGYSTIWISLGLEETGGKMQTIEIKPDRVEMAKKNVADAGLSDRVTFNLGDAHEIVPKLDGPFDFVFLDADKDGQMDYFKKVYPNKLTRGGILAVHNAIKLRSPMEDYLEMIGQHPDFDSVILSLTMEDGFSISYRHRV